MSDTPIDRAAIRQRARLRAERMGHRPRPEEDAAAEVELPTDNLFALRGFLSTGKLTPAQAVVARQRLADAAGAATEQQNAFNTPPAVNFPEDAA